MSMMTEEEFKQATQALDRVVGVYEDVDVPKLGRVKMAPLPFLTMVHVVAELLAATRGEARELQEALAEGLKQITADSKTTTAAEIQAVLDMAMPLVTRLAAASPRLALRVVLDVVPGSTERHVARMPVESVLFIIRYAVESVDVEVAADEVRRVFTAAAKVRRRAAAEGGTVTPSALAASPAA